jgi:hypothetical protein
MVLFEPKNKQVESQNGIFRSDNNGAIIELILPVALKGRKTIAEPKP